MIEYGLIYIESPPRPKWWQHPIRWWRWRPAEPIGFIDMSADMPPDADKLTITFGPPEERNA